MKENMTKIVLDPVQGEFNLSKLNDNFRKIEDELNDKVLYRDNPQGEPNTLETDIDMNEHTIYNVRDIQVSGKSIFDLSGVRGEKGDPGVPGPKGDKGDKGEKGDKGAPGEGSGSDVPSVVDYDTVALADASAKHLWTSDHFTVPSIANKASLKANYWGIGSIKTADNNKTAKYFTHVSAPPAVGDHNQPDTAFNGNWKDSPFPVEHRISGSTTLGTPATGYLYRPEAYPHYTYVHNTSGWNQSTNSNNGRTAVCAYRTKVDNFGQGDSVAYNATVLVNSVKPGATHFLASPAGSILNGEVAGFAAGVYLNPYEINMHDNGYAMAAVGQVHNYFRENASTALSAVWVGERHTNFGSAPCDAVFTAAGKWITGIDFSMGPLDFGANQAAISLKAGQRIYFNNVAGASGSLEAGWRATTFNKDYIHYDAGQINTIVGGRDVFGVSPNYARVNGGFAVYHFDTLVFDLGNSVPNKLFLGNTGYTISMNQKIQLTSQTVATTATAGTASALPSAPQWYLTVQIDSTDYKIPLYKV